MLERIDLTELEAKVIAATGEVGSFYTTRQRGPAATGRRPSLTYRAARRNTWKRPHGVSPEQWRAQGFRSTGSYRRERERLLKARRAIYGMGD